MTLLLPCLLPLALGGAPAASSPDLLREVIGETALAQLRRPDPRWQESQRDCAGLVRFVYRTAYARFAPERVAAGLFADDHGQPSFFADARNLVAQRFDLLGRGAALVDALQTGDLLAFQQGPGDGDEVMHLMLVVRPPDRAHAPMVVIYHPGTAGAALRSGTFEALLRDAPEEWRPVATNSAFLGFYRWKEWNRG